MLNALRAITLLALSSMSAVVGAEEAYWEYTFRPGDSIWNISKTYTNSVNNWFAIQELNQISQGPDKRIRPGTRIKIPVSMLKIQPAYASVISVSGDATITTKDGEDTAATTQSRLFSGDEIRTGDNANVTIRFADGSELLLLQNSQAQMDTLSAHAKTGMVDTRVRLKSGQLDTRVNKLNLDSRYEIITPAAVAAVRGTAFRISADGSIMRSEVTDGIVAVAAASDEKSLNAGFGLVAEKDKPLPEPVKLLEPPEISDVFYITDYQQNISWTPLANADAYRIQLAESETFNKLVFDKVGKDSNTIIEMLENKTYSLRVRGIDAQQLQGLNAYSAIDVSIKPTAPALTAIKSDKAISFNWSPGQHSSKTVIQISREATFNDIVDTIQLSDNNYTTKELSSGTYYYRSKTIDHRGVESEYSDIASIDTIDENDWLNVIGIGVIIFLL